MVISNTKQSRSRQYPLIIIMATLTILINYIAWDKLSNFKDHIKVVYVSQDEIIALERARTESELEQLKKNIKEDGKVSKPELFYGKPEKAVELLEKYSKAREDNRTFVIYSNGPVYSKGVNSISKAVYADILGELSNDKTITK